MVWIIYFIDTLTSEGGSAVIGLMIGVVFTFLYYLGKFEDKAPDFNKILPNKIIFIVCTVLILHGVLVPSKDTAYKMLAFYGVNEITNNESVQKLGSKSLLVIERAMDDYLEESKPKK